MADQPEETVSRMANTQCVKCMSANFYLVKREKNDKVVSPTQTFVIVRLTILPIKLSRSVHHASTYSSVTAAAKHSHHRGNLDYFRSVNFRLS